MSPRVGGAGLRALRVGLAALCVVALNAGCALLQATDPSFGAPAPGAAAVDTAATGAVQSDPRAAHAAAGLATAPEVAAARAEPAIKVEVDAPDAVAALLRKHLDLLRLQQLPEDEVPDESELVRLVAAAPQQVRQLLQTEGWFNPEVAVSRDAARPRLVQVRVVPGPRVQVVQLRVEVDGALAEQADAGDAAAQAQRAGLVQGNALKPGLPFRNPDWADTKQQVVARLRAAGWAAARLADSRAEIDAIDQQANLSLKLASGPLFRLGQWRIEGLVHHDAATVRNLAGFDPGTPLTETALLDFQDRLQRAGLFGRAAVTFEPDEAQAGAMPVTVTVGELPLQQAVVGLGVSANTGPRASLEHTHRRPFGRALVAHNKLEWGRDAQSWTGDLTTHPGENFYRNLLGVQISRLKSNTDVVLSQRLRLGRTQDTQRIERLYFGEWLRSRLSNAQGVNTATAVSGNYHVVWRDLDSALLPTRGISLSLQTGAGFASSAGSAHPSGAFARLYGRITGYLPLGEQWYGQVRLEAGQVVKPSAVAVPDALGFRAGGDDSVRGYAYRSLAPVDADGTVRSGMVMGSASIELARPVSARLPAVWGAVFADIGNAADAWSTLRPVRGYGVGVRWRSPIGPLRVDLAWADALRKLRLHMSVGIAF